MELKLENSKNMYRKARTTNSTLAIGGVSCSADSLVVAESFVLRINICGENRHLRQARKRYKQLIDDNETQ